MIHLYQVYSSCSAVVFLLFLLSVVQKMVAGYFHQNFDPDEYRHWQEMHHALWKSVRGCGG